MVWGGGGVGVGTAGGVVQKIRTREPVGDPGAGACPELCCSASCDGSGGEGAGVGVSVTSSLGGAGIGAAVTAICGLLGCVG